MGSHFEHSGIEAVILDMDGLMLDTEALYKIAFQKAAAQLGYVFDDDFYFTLVGQPYTANEISITERFGTAFPLGEFGGLWPKLWREEVDANGIPLKPGLPELLDFLAFCAIPVAIATSSDRKYADFSLAAAKLDSHRFVHVVTGEQVTRGKPEPDIYLEAARRLGIPPPRILAIEDSDAGIRSASSAGMIAILVPDLKAPSEQAREAAFRVFDTLHDVVALLEGRRDASN